MPVAVFRWDRADRSFRGQELCTAFDNGGMLADEVGDGCAADVLHGIQALRHDIGCSAETP